MNIVIVFRSTYPKKRCFHRSR